MGADIWCCSACRLWLPSDEDCAAHEEIHRLARRAGPLLLGDPQRALAQVFRERLREFEPVEIPPGFVRPASSASLLGFLDWELAWALWRVLPNRMGPNWAGYAWEGDRIPLFSRPFGSLEMRIEAVELDESLRLYALVEVDCFCGIGIVALGLGRDAQASDLAFRKAFRETEGAAFGTHWPCSQPADRAA